MKRHGFTIVELVVVMAVMGILLSLGVIGFASSQANARDAKRSADIEAIAKGLEARYTRGNPYATASYIAQGSYPSVYEIQHAEGTYVASVMPQSATAYITSLLVGTAQTNFAPPNYTGDPNQALVPICGSACGAAENQTTINSALALANDVYVYEPITSTNQVCINTECVRYNLYYKQESNGGAVIKESSKRQ